MRKCGANRVKRIIFCIILVATSLLIGLFAIFFFESQGEIQVFNDNKGGIMINSIAEKRFVEINGTKIGMIIRGENINNPLIVFVHGGPGMPEYFLAEKYFTKIEKHFTVCYFEQRGAGLSYLPKMQGEDLTSDLLIQDINKVSAYLCDTFQKDKVYLLGHSWGTFIGIQAAKLDPSRYYAYIGVGQISNQKESEKLGYEYMIKEFTKNRDFKNIDQLKEFDLTDSKGIKLYMESATRDNLMHKLLIGTTHEMDSIIKGIFLPVMACNAYTMKEKINIWKAKAFLNQSTNLRMEMLNADLPEQVNRLEIPTYFISGEYDYTVNHQLSKRYLDLIRAPKKKFYLFKDCAHSPMFENQERFLEILKEEVTEQ